ncbi:MAG: DUF262 domain-containing protein [Holophagaceae bacterium]
MPFTPVQIRYDNAVQLGSERMNALFANAPFRVPTYQRNYKWSSDDFEKLLIDLRKLEVGDDFEGNQNLKAHYMGNLFFFHDTAEGLLNQSFEIIDGQQRLTTCLIFLSIIFFELKIALGYPNLPDQGDIFRAKYITMRSRFLGLMLQRYDGAFFSRFQSGYGDLPLARFIMHITNGQGHVEDAVYDFQNPLDFTPTEGSDQERRFLDSVKMASKAIMAHLEKPTPEALEQGGAIAYCNNLLKLVVQIMDGLQFGVVTMTDESDAYKVFVNINSTGKPLSHFEIFCARIDRKISNLHPENQISRIRDLLNQIQSELSYKDEGKTNITKENSGFDEILDYWSVYDQPETNWIAHDPAGTLATDINSPGMDGARIENILRGLLKIKKLLNRPREAVKDDSQNQEQLLCLTLLVEHWPMGIHLVLPFYLNSEVRSNNYTRPLKKIVAFWTLFRMIQSGRNTGKIQVAYLEKMIRSANPVTADDLPMKDITVIDLERGLKIQLASCTRAVAVDPDNLFSVDDEQLIAHWSQASSTIQSEQAFVNRTILMFAYHNTLKQDPAQYKPNVSLVPANPHVDIRLTFSFFQTFVKDGTLEHICPQDQNELDPWNDVDERYVALIGNMHLAPKATNTSLSNKGPLQKKYLYEFFAAQHRTQRDDIADEMQDLDIPVNRTDRGVQIRADHTIFNLVFNYHTWVWVPDAQHNQPIWNSAAIEERSLDICKRAVTNLLVWLNC